jgi:hypothetical protein
MLKHLAAIDNITSVLRWNITTNGNMRLYSTDIHLVPNQVVQILQATWTLVNLTIPFFSQGTKIRQSDSIHASLHIEPTVFETRPQSHTRCLLFNEILTGVDASIQELEALRTSYSDQIGDIFNYRYAEASTAQTRAAWLYDFGPDKTVQHSPCKVLVDITAILKEAFIGLDIALRSQYAQSHPAANLGNAVRVIFHNNVPESNGNVISTEQEQDTFAWTIAQGVVHVQYVTAE